MWVDGTSLNAHGYVNWNYGEPNRHLNKEYCGTIVLTNKRILKWNDYKCILPHSEKLGYVCERKRQMRKDC